MDDLQQQTMIKMELQSDINDKRQSDLEESLNKAYQQMRTQDTNAREFNSLKAKLEEEIKKKEINIGHVQNDLRSMIDYQQEVS